MTYLLFAVLVMTVGISVVVMRNRPSTSMEASIDDFQRGLRALAPEGEESRTAVGSSERDPDPDPELEPEPGAAQDSGVAPDPSAVPAEEGD